MAEGMKTALAALSAEAPVIDQSEQLALLPEKEAKTLKNGLRAPCVHRGGGKGGRPKGAANRSTQEWTRYLAGKYGSPLEGLCDLYGRDIRELAQELELYRRDHLGNPMLDREGNPQLNLVEAFKLQQNAMMAALPFMHSKMPQAIQVQNKERGLLIVGELGADSEAQALSLFPEEYQELNTSNMNKSDDGKSDE